MNIRTVARCLYCIDGFMPDGIHPVLGPVYIRCLACISTAAIRACLDCYGESWIPADPSCLHCLGNHLAAQGITGVLCRTCDGITALIGADQTPEVDP